MRRSLARVTPLAVAATLAAAAAGCGEPGAPTESPSPATGSSPSSSAGSGEAGSPGATPGDPTGTGPSTDDGRTLTPADDGAVLHLQVGDVVELHLPDGSAPEPRVIGEAIEVAETVNLAPADGREWEVRAVRIGEASLTGSSDGRTFELRFRVRG